MLKVGQKQYEARKYADIELISSVYPSLKLLKRLPPMVAPLRGIRAA